MSDGGQPWYLAVCRGCGPEGDPMVMPFRDRQERDEWTVGHVAANPDHDVRAAQHA